MSKKTVFVLLIALFLLGNVTFAQDKKEENKLDFADIQSTPEKVLANFFEFYKKCDVENLKKIVNENLYDELDKMSEIKEFMKEVNFYFKTNEITTKDSFSIAIIEICMTSPDKKSKIEIEIIPIYLSKTGEKWFVKGLNDQPEKTPEWAAKIAKSVEDNNSFMRRFREGQASPYFVVHEFVASLAEKDGETMKSLIISGEKYQKTIDKITDGKGKPAKIITKILSVYEKENYAVCHVEIKVEVEGLGPSKTVFVLKNEGINVLPNWKIVPLLLPDLIIADKELGIPEWVKNWTKWCVSKTDDVKDKEKLLPHQFELLQKHMLAGEFDKLSEFFDESQNEIIDKIKNEIAKITKFEYQTFHIKGNEALLYGTIEVVKSGGEDTDSDDLVLLAKFKDGKWFFFIDPNSEKMSWVDEIGETWETLRKNSDKANYRPSSAFKKKVTPEGYGYGYGDGYGGNEPSKKDVPSLEIGKPLTGEIEGYRITNVNLKIEKAGLYRFVAKSLTKNAFTKLYLKQNDLSIGNDVNFKGKTVLETYLIPGNYQIQVAKGFDTPNDISVVKFEVMVVLLDPMNLHESCPKIELDKEYVFENLNSATAREFFYISPEAGYFTLDFMSDASDKSVSNQDNLTLSVQNLPTRWFDEQINIPTTKLVFLTKGLNKITLTKWNKQPVKVKFKMKKTDMIKSGDSKTINIPKNSAVGWQFKLDVTTKVKFELSGTSSNQSYITIFSKNTDTKLRSSWGKVKVLEDILDQGVYLIKVTGNYSKDLQDIVLKADFKAVEFTKVEPKFKSQSIILDKNELNSKEHEIDLSGYESSKFVCIKVLNNATGELIPDAAIRIGKSKLDGMTGKEYTRMKTLGRIWNNSMNGQGCIYGYMLPMKYSLKVGVYSDAKEVKVEITLDDNIQKFEVGTYKSIMMKKNEIALYKVNFKKARCMILDELHLSSQGAVQIEIWSNGFELDFTDWLSDNGKSKHGLFTEGSFIIVVKRTPRTKWLPNPEIEELPVILNLIENLNDH